MPSYSILNDYIFAVNKNGDMHLVSNVITQTFYTGQRKEISIGDKRCYIENSLHDDIDSKSNGTFLPELYDIDLLSCFGFMLSSNLVYALQTAGIRHKDISAFIIINIEALGSTVTELSCERISVAGEETIVTNQADKDRIINWLVENYEAPYQRHNEQYVFN